MLPGRSASLQVTEPAGAAVSWSGMVSTSSASKPAPAGLTGRDRSGQHQAAARCRPGHDAVGVDARQPLAGRRRQQSSRYPTSSATRALAGLSTTSSGSPSCSTHPESSTAIRLANAWASASSCATSTAGTARSVTSATTSAVRVRRRPASRPEYGSSSRSAAQCASSSRPARPGAAGRRTAGRAWRRAGHRSRARPPARPARVRAGRWPGVAQVVANRQVREQAGILPQQADLAPPGRNGDPRSGCLVSTRPSSSTRPARGWTSPAMVSSSVDFPAPDGPNKASRSPGATSMRPAR